MLLFSIVSNNFLLYVQHESAGHKAGFSYFVFQQLYESRQFSKLLRLGEEFQEDLSNFLQEHQDLQWLHELFLHQFSSASETLHSLALSQDGNSISSAEKRMDPDSGTSGKKLVERRRLLNLSKIAAMAGLLILSTSLHSLRPIFLYFFLFLVFGEIILA